MRIFAVICKGSLAFFLLCIAFPAYANVLHVSATGDNSSGGSTWNLAKKTVQAGIDAAASNDEVWVAAGTYAECIMLEDGIALYGGFTGNEESRDQRNWVENVTALDGNAEGSVVTALDCHSSATIIDGFTITNGTGTSTGGWEDASSGGGIYSVNASLTVSNNLITGNFANGFEGCGGGIYCNGGSPEIIGNTITDNYVFGEYGSGGGIYCAYVTNALIRHNTISGNGVDVYMDGSGGGIYCSGTAIISHNTISNNSMPMNWTHGWGDGGGIYCDSAVVENNSITDNEDDGVYGGAVQHNKISGNEIGIRDAKIAEGNDILNNGIGIYGGRTVSNNLILGNGRGVASAQIATNNTIIRNTYGLHVTETAANNIVAWNGLGFYQYWYGSPILRNNCVYANILSDYSNIMPGEGDFSDDPKLAWDSDCHIQADSACRDAGWNDAPGIASTDVDNEPRIQNTIDVGADESDGTLWAALPVIYASVSGNNTNDGLTWRTAKRTIQAAITALAGSDGEVWVSEGVYSGEIRFTRGLRLYGGFSGKEKSRDERDWNEHICVLNGAISVGRDTDLCAVDGFTLQDGIACGKSSPEIANNKISGRPAAGIHCGYMAHPQIYNNIITHNAAGIECVEASPLIFGNTISDNQGTGIWCDSYASPIIANNRILKNTASGKFGGGIFSGDWCNLLISGNLIAENTAEYGGGIGQNSSRESGFWLVNNTIVANTASDGGAIGYTWIAWGYAANNIVAFNSSGINYIDCEYSLLADVDDGELPPMDTWNNNCIYGNNGDDYNSSTHGNMSLDPLFRNLQNGDYHLRWNSPCVNAGFNDAENLPDTDIDGEGRIGQSAVDIGADEYSPLKVEVDIIPGKYPNHINPRRNGLVPVAVISSSDFIADSISPSTVRLADAVPDKWKTEDVDKDGDLDLLLYFRSRSLMLEPDASEALLTGRMMNGEFIEGVDSVLITGKM